MGVSHSWELLSPGGLSLSLLMASVGGPSLPLGGLFLGVPSFGDPPYIPLNIKWLYKESDLTVSLGGVSLGGLSLLRFSLSWGPVSLGPLCPRVAAKRVSPLLTRDHPHTWPLNSPTESRLLQHPGVLNAPHVAQTQPRWGWIHANDGLALTPTD